MVNTDEWGRKTVLISAACGLMLLMISVHGYTEEKAVHPDLSEQEMLNDCAACHRDATPDIEKEWNDSLHGIAMVKCYQCHGTFETFVVEPARENCATCHADKMENHANKLGKAADTPCWECHVPHSFQAKK